MRAPERDRAQREGRIPSGEHLELRGAGRNGKESVERVWRDWHYPGRSNGCGMDGKGMRKNQQDITETEVKHKGASPQPVSHTADRDRTHSGAAGGAGARRRGGSRLAAQWESICSFPESHPDHKGLGMPRVGGGLVFPQDRDSIPRG